MFQRRAVPGDFRRFQQWALSMEGHSVKMGAFSASGCGSALFRRH